MTAEWCGLVVKMCRKRKYSDLSYGDECLIFTGWTTGASLDRITIVLPALSTRRRLSRWSSYEVGQRGGQIYGSLCVTSNTNRMVTHCRQPQRFTQLGPMLSADLPISEVLVLNASRRVPARDRSRPTASVRPEPAPSIGGVCLLLPMTSASEWNGSGRIKKGINEPRMRTATAHTTLLAPSMIRWSTSKLILRKDVPAIRCISKLDGKPFINPWSRGAFRSASVSVAALPAIYLLDGNRPVGRVTDRSSIVSCI